MTDQPAPDTAASQPTPGAQQQPTQPTAPTWSVREIANMARSRYNTVPSIVRAAFKSANLQEATLEDADRVVKEFMEKPAPHRRDPQEEQH